MTNNFSESLNTITELYNGHYCVKIQMDSDLDILKIINLSYKFIWILEYSEYLNEWTSSCNTIFKNQSNPEKVFIRNDNMEILMDTQYFYDLLKRKGQVRNYLHIIQTDVVPPYYLDLKKFVGKNKYIMLKQHINYLFEIIQMGDYELIISSKKEFLEDILRKLN